MAPVKTSSSYNEQHVTQALFLQREINTHIYCKMSNCGAYVINIKLLLKNKFAQLHAVCLVCRRLQVIHSECVNILAIAVQ